MCVAYIRSDRITLELEFELKLEFGLELEFMLKLEFGLELILELGFGFLGL